MLLALIEAFVLRSTGDLNVWRTLLVGMLVADVGHVWSVRGSMSVSGYWEVWEWNAIDWGNLGFVYVAAAFRVCFIAGVGMKPKVASKKSVEAVKST